MIDLEELLFCDVCQLAVATRGEVYAVIQRRYEFTVDQLSSPQANLRVFHSECSLIPETLATLPIEQARQIAVETLSNPDGFGFTLNAPRLRGF